MWLAIKIGAFYGVPILAAAIAIAYLAVLLLRFRRGGLSRRRAAALSACTLLLPFAAVAVVWGTAEVASYSSVASERYVWDGGAALRLFIDLLPIAAYVGAPIAILVVSFWVTLVIWKSN